MLDKKVHELLNQQINKEFYSAYLYLDFSNYFSRVGLDGFANKNGVLDSALDGIGIGLGFTCSLTLLGLVREILGRGSAFGFKFIAGDGILAFVLAPGAFIALAYLIVVFRKLTSKKAE